MDSTTMRIMHTLITIAIVFVKVLAKLAENQKRAAHGWQQEHMHGDDGFKSELEYLDDLRNGFRSQL